MNKSLNVTDEERLQKRRQSRLNWYHRNKESCDKKSRDYSKKNRVKRNQIQRDYRKRLKESDPSYKCWENARKRIWKIMNTQKRNKTRDLIGTTPIFFKLWIEYTFSANMTWENYGEYWHIDHVVPIATFNKDDTNEIFEAFNWTNCRAETKDYNIQKNDTIDPAQVKRQNEYLKYFNNIMIFKKSLKMEICNQLSKKLDKGSTTR